MSERQPDPNSMPLLRKPQVPSGLTSAEASSRLKEFGLNEPVKSRRLGSLTQLLVLFLNPLVIILLVACVVSFVVGNWVNASIIIAMVLLSVALNFTQTARSRSAVQRLSSTVAPTATVLRDAVWSEIARREVVPGDLIKLRSGDLVPADARLLDSRNLHVQESALTGESLPVKKSVGSDEEGNEKDVNLLFLGTSVISGTGTAVVTSTGQATKFGDIAAQLSRKAPETEFERGTRQFGYLIARVVFVLVIFVFFVNALMHRDPLESLLFSIALAVGLTPEFLPMIMTVTLGQGAKRMGKQKVIVKHLEAIQNFGSIDILCSDKTGTLTRGEMTLGVHVDPMGEPSEFPFYLAYLNSYFETGVTHPLNTAITASHLADPLDAAILFHDHPTVVDLKKIDEIPFDFERRRVSIAVEGKDGHRMLVTKGAPESVLAVCSGFRVGQNDKPLDDKRRAAILDIFYKFSSSGFRVLGVAMKEPGTASQYTPEDETGLIFAGFVTFADEPLESASAALRSLKKDGIQVKILTGDNELVTRHVCEQVGLESGRIVLGDEMDSMSDAALGQVAEAENIFARVSPRQKNRILLALKARGHVVGFLGDGINDAPSLHTADVGISVSTASDVAKDAAEIVLLERSLKVLHNGIIEGRKSFGNVMKYLLMGTSSNFGNMFSMAGAVIFLPFLPMLPTQILLNNFLYDLAQITIPSDNVDKAFIRKPHRWDIKLIRNFMLFIGPVSSVYDFLTFWVLLKVFMASEHLFQTGWFVESLATQTMVVFVIRTAGNPFRSRPSRLLALTVIGVVLFAIILPFIPGAAAFGFVPLPLGYFLFLAAATVTYLVLVEIVKRHLFRRMLG